MKNAVAFYTNKNVVFLLATLCCFLWGSSYPAIKNGYALFHIADGDIPGKLLFAGYRFVFAGALLLLLAKASGKALTGLKPGQAKQLALLGLGQTAVQYTIFYIGLAHTTGIKGSIMNATQTFFSVLLAHYLYKNDKLSVNKSLGCIVGFAGVAIVNLKGLSDFSFSLMGDGFVVISAFMLSAGAIYGKRISENMDATIMTGYQLAFGGAVMVGLGYLCGGHIAIDSADAFWVLFFLVLISSVSFALWSQLMKYNKVGAVAPFNFLIPVAGTLLSGYFLNERILEWRYAIALVLVCLGIRLVNRSAWDTPTAARAQGERAR